MPAYDFENSETGCIEERIMSYTKLEQFKKDNPHLKQVITGTPGIVSGIGNRSGLGNSGGFNEMLSKVADAHPRSELAKATKRRSASEVKTDAIIDKHVKIQQQMKKEGKPLNKK